GALAFPGGRIDEDDRLIATDDSLWRGNAGDEDERAHRIGAIREALEETGIPVGIFPHPPVADIPEWRSALKQGAPFSQLLREAGALLDLALLHPWARWCPKFSGHRRFDTRFY